MCIGSFMILMRIISCPKSKKRSEHNLHHIYYSLKLSAGKNEMKLLRKIQTKNEIINKQLSLEIHDTFTRYKGKYNV